MKQTILKLAVLMGGAAVASLVAVSCGSQPPASCQMLGHYRLVMTAKTNTGNCPTVDAETMDFQVFSAVPDAGEFKFVYRPSGVFDVLGGGQTDDAGMSPDGFGIIPLESNGGLCATKDWTPSAQNFDPLTLEDGGVVPATSISYKWNSLEVLSTARALGTLLRGELVKTVDGCSVTYSVTGIGPVAACADAVDCYPFKNPDGGRPATKTGISENVSLLPDGTSNLVCTNAGVDTDGNPTGVCDVDFSKRSFDDIVKAVR